MAAYNMMGLWNVLQICQVVTRPIYEAVMRIRHRGGSILETGQGELLVARWPDRM